MFIQQIIEPNKQENLVHAKGKYNQYFLRKDIRNKLLTTVQLV